MNQQVLYSPDCTASPAHVDCQIFLNNFTAVRGLIDFPGGTEQERRAAAASPTPMFAMWQNKLI